jgi:hypothetical protein
MFHSQAARCFSALFGLGILLVTGCLAHAAPLTRDEVLAIAKSYAEHRWTASPRNVLHGFDAEKVAVETPDQGTGRNDPNLWTVDTDNVGIPYQWGGFDSVASFDAGVSSGKAAGDLYTPEKRRLADRAVSAHAVGVDCSGFISRCWKLPQKYGTATLASISKELSSPSALQPGDIMNAAGGHVILFAKWLDDAKTRALFYEAQPYSKVMANEYAIAELTAEGFRPLRYRQIRD